MTFRAVTLLDAPLLYRWRQQAEQHPWYVGAPVGLLEHRQWLTRRLRCKLVKLRVWTEGGRARGMVRLDSGGELSFQAESVEVGRAMLRLVRGHAPGYGGRLKACVDRGDTVACEALLAAGFVEATDAIRFFVYRP